VTKFHLNQWHRRSIITAGIVCAMMTLILFVFDLFESRIGHAISIASFSATTVTIALNPTQRVSWPSTVFLSYALAATIGFAVGLIPIPTLAQVPLAMTVLIGILLWFDRMHPPAIGYIFGFIIGGYGLWEFILTFPSLLSYFIALGVVILIVEQISYFLGILEKTQTESRPRSTLEWIEYTVDRTVPLALIVLFLALLVEFAYPEQLKAYRGYLTFIDVTVIAIFTIDLIFKFKRAADTRAFFKTYWADILATVPFFILFRVFQGVFLGFGLLTRGTGEMVTDLARFTRFLRPLARFPRFARLIKHIETISPQ